MKKLAVWITPILIALLVCTQDLNAQISPPPDESGDVQHGCGAGCIIGIAVILIAGFLVYKMRDFCKKHLPPPNCDPPPPPSKGTNSVSFVGMWPTDSQNQTTLPALDDTAVDLLDITGHNWRDDFGNPYVVSWNTTLQSSYDLLSWNDVCVMTGYISFGYTNLDWPSNAVTVSYRDGEAVWTNWGDNPYPLAESDRQFYRLKHL